MSAKRKEREAFKNIYSIESFIERIKNNNENTRYLLNNYFNDNTIEESIECIKNISNNKEKEERFIKFLHFVDNKLNFAGQSSENRRQKIPTIFAGAIYIDKYEKEFNIYTSPQKMIIAKYSAVEELDFYKNINNNFSRELMDTIVNKNKDWSFQDDFMKIAMKYKNYKTDSEIIEYLNKTDDGDLIRESFKEFQDTIEKIGARI